MASAEPLKKITDRLNSPKTAVRACLVICPDDTRLSRVVARIRESLSSSAETEKLSGRDLNEDALQKTFFGLQNASLFASEKHLIVDGVDALNAQLGKSLLEYLEDAGQNVVMIASAPKLASNLSLYKFFEKHEMIFTLPELTGAELEKWIARELTQAGVTRFPSTAPSLIRQASGESADRAIEIVEKIALYLDTDTLSAEDLRKLIPLESRVDEFDFIARIASSPRAKLEAMISQLLAQGVSPFPLLGLLSRNYTSYHAINYLMKSGMSPEQCARHIGSPPWLAAKIAPLAQKYSAAQLRHCFGAIARADSLLKNRSLGNEAILSELLENITP